MNVSKAIKTILSNEVNNSVFHLYFTMIVFFMSPQFLEEAG